MAKTNDELFVTALRSWGRTVTVEARLGGGNRNDVRAVRVGGVRYAARCSRRLGESLDWELNLLDRLAAAGFRVPRPLPTVDGRRRVGGMVVLEWVDGDPPSSPADWRRVADTLHRLHDLTHGWEQRPGFRSTQELLTAERGADIRLDLMPRDVVDRCRAAWRGLAGEPTSVVHGDPGAPNLRLAGSAVGLLDWDEARVDVSLLDLADLPVDPPVVIDDRRLHLARRAANAWEAANSWFLEPRYARRRLAQR